MTFRKRIMVAFFTVIVVPMLLFAIAFIALGNYLVGEDGELKGYNSIVGDYDDYDTEAESLYILAAQNQGRLGDVEFLDQLSSQIRGRNNFLTVRRGNDLYYSSDEQMARTFFDLLPAFDKEKAGNSRESDFIRAGRQSLMVRQVDFYFPDLSLIHI